MEATIQPIPETELEHLVTPYFRHQTIENVPQSEIHQRPVMELVEVVELRFAGDKNFSPVLPVDAMYRREGHRVITYAERFGDQYRAFQSGEDQMASGTPLEMLVEHGITPAQISLCRAAKVYSIEALYHLEGRSLKTLGQSGNVLKDMARRFMERRPAPQSDDRIKELEAEIARLKAAAPLPPKEASPAEIEEAANKPLDEMDDGELKAFIKSKAGRAPTGTPSREWLLSAAKELA